MAKLVTDRQYPNILNRRGVRWDLAKLPRHWHICRMQSVGTYNRWCDYYEWCRCGARRRVTVMGYVGRWTKRNSRRNEAS